MISNDELYAAGSQYLDKLDNTVGGWLHLVIAVLFAVIAINVLIIGALCTQHAAHR